jgi:hypothetical protein
MLGPSYIRAAATATEMSAAASHIFGVMMPDHAEMPDARASRALRTELVLRFREHHFVFVERSEIPDGDDLPVFRVFAAGIMDDNDNELGGPIAGPELVAEIQSAVDEIVRAAKVRSIH